MKEKITSLLEQAEAYSIENTDHSEQFRLKFLSKKGELNNLFADFKNVPNEEKKEIGALINAFKEFCQSKYDASKELFSASASAQSIKDDFTKPGFPYASGGIHPLTTTRQRIISIFEKIGFTVASGPEIEDDWHNFSALNFPENHPARDMQDTFYITEDKNTLLRTHTSSVQIRMMENQQPPLRILMPGRVYRNETISARAHCTFHQVEGLYIDEGVSFADLKQTMFYFVREMFGQNTEIRFRPSFFPFTEPSAEVDISCFICDSKGCPVCKQSGWVEIGGCGMVDPVVMENCNLDPKKYSGFAFGMGIERVTMLKYQISDLRLFFENDLRFLKQFKQA
jgi:phenylalanyl-tRNA synthetase alpha chain